MPHENAICASLDSEADVRHEATSGGTFDEPCCAEENSSLVDGAVHRPVLDGGGFDMYRSSCVACGGIDGGIFAELSNDRPYSAPGVGGLNAHLPFIATDCGSSGDEPVSGAEAEVPVPSDSDGVGAGAGGWTDGGFECGTRLVEERLPAWSSEGFMSRLSPPSE